jgi:hypothetical protein
MTEKPSPARVAARTGGEFITEGDTVEILTRRIGWAEGTIVSVRNMRGGKTEIKMATADGKDFHWKAPSDRYADPAVARVVRYKGAVPKGKALKDMEAARERDNVRSERKTKKVMTGREALAYHDPKPGDQVLYGYSNTTRWETVVNTNTATGKVGISTGHTNDNADIGAVTMFMLLGVKPKTKREVRWLPAEGILEVRPGTR